MIDKKRSVTNKMTKVFSPTVLCCNALCNSSAPLSPILLLARLSLVNVYVKIRNIGMKKEQMMITSTVLLRNASHRY